MLNEAVRLSTTVSQDKLVVSLEVQQQILQRADGSEWARVFLSMFKDDYGFTGARSAEEARKWLEIGRAAYHAMEEK